MMRSRWFRRAAAVAGLAASAAAMLELSVTLADIAPPPLASLVVWNEGRDRDLLADVGLFRLDRQLLWDLRAGADDIDIAGYRALGTAATDGAVPRIAVVGDGTAFGNNVALASTWPAQLQSLLLARGRPAAVLDFGVSEYSSVQVRRSYELRARPLSPRLVIACLGDYADAAAPPCGIDDLGRLRLLDERIGPHSSFLRRFDSLRWLRCCFMGGPANVSYGADQRVAAAEQTWQLGALRDEVAADGGHLLLVLGPVPPRGLGPRPLQRLLETTTALGIPVVRADLALAGLGTEGTFDASFAWTPAAHQVVAMAVVDAAAEFVRGP
jgi:hypothetical protein